MRHALLAAMITVSLFAGVAVVAQSTPDPYVARKVQVEPGDWLGRFAARWGTTPDAVVSANPWLRSNGLRLFVGDELDLPANASDSPVPATTSTTVPATTSTTVPSTTVPSTTVPSTTVPSSGVQFVESFDQQSALDRFTFAAADGSQWPGDGVDWFGDHADLGDGACEGPTTTRPLSTPSGSYPDPFAPFTYDDATIRLEGWAYWCDPNSATVESNHMMTSFATNGYAHLDFRIDEQLTDVSQVCWSQNVTDVGSGNWTQVAVVAADLFAVNGDRMDYTIPSYNEGAGSPGGWGLPIAGDIFVGSHTSGNMVAVVDRAELTAVPSKYVTEDRAFRGRHCWLDNGDGSVTGSIERPDGTIDSGSAPGSFPAGDVVVIFQHANYDPTKRPGFDGNEFTWHWDDIEVN